MMRRILIIVLGFFSLVCQPVSAAQRDFHLGSLKIKPSLSTAVTSNDNVYSTAQDVKEDIIVTTKPGLQLTLPILKHSVSLDVGTTFVRHQKYKEENTTGYFAGGAIELRLGHRLGLNLSDRYTKGFEPRGTSSTGFIEAYKTNTVYAAATYKLSDRLTFRLDFAPTVYRYKTSSYLNRDEAATSGYVYYRFLPKVSAFVEYDHKTIAYSRQTFGMDSAENGGQLGLTWEISERTKGTVKGGTMLKEYEDPALPVVRSWISSVDVSHELTGRTSISLSGQRSVSESSVTGNRYLIATGGSAELGYAVTRKVTASVRGTYVQDDFSDAVPPDTTIRADRTITGGAGLKYAVKDWLSLGVAYSTSTRRSNLPENDYVARSLDVAANMSF